MTTPSLSTSPWNWTWALVEDPAQGIYRCNREIFIDPDLFDLEMKYIFEGNWIYLAHESQLAENGDDPTTWIGPGSWVRVPDPDRGPGGGGQRVRSSRRAWSAAAGRTTGPPGRARSTAGPTGTTARC